MSLLLILGAVSAVAGEPRWHELSTVTYPSVNIEFHARWRPGSGLQVKVSPTGITESVVLDLNPKKARVLFSSDDAFPSSAREFAQFSEGALPATAADDVLVVLKLRMETWTVHVDDRLVTVLPAPFPAPATVSAPRDALVSVESDAVYVQKVADFRFADSFMVPVDQKEKLGRWEKESGDWTLHTAMDSSIERGTIQPGAKKHPEPDHSPNFYSLRGRGTNAIITSGYEFYDAYSLEAAVKVSRDEAGLVFLRKEGGGYHAFTARLETNGPSALLSLWHLDSTNRTVRRNLGAVRTPMTDGQWIKLKVTTFQNRIQCAVDNVDVLDVQAELPVGGRFGLFADSDAGAHFDDVSAHTSHRLDFANLSALRRHCILEDGHFFPRRRFLHLFPPRAIDTALEVPEARKAQRLIVGSTAHRGQVFSARFTPGAPAGSVGLIGGYRGDDEAYYLFQRLCTVSNEVFTLDRVSPGDAALLETIEFPLDPAPDGGGVESTLMFDATHEGEMRMYCDGRLVLVHHPEQLLAGASGLYVGAGTAARISEPTYAFAREDQYRNKIEKNELFIEDKFMRHWSSPEGVWLPMTNDLIWHKSDFFGRFTLTMPFVANSEIHLGVQEGHTNGALVLAVGKKRIELSLASGDGALQGLGRLSVADLETVSVEKREKGKVTGTETLQRYSVHYEDHWIWVTSGGRVLLKRPLRTALQGRRIRLAGFSAEQLRHSDVARYHVKDYLFVESPHGWTMNGGKWQVVNRFQCRPSWSHMNGESKDSLAALWTKYRYSGDFCMEMYAGMRHQWYKRPGDLNITVMNDATSPGRGYTVTCTGWDPDHSQRYTKLFRNGKILGVTDKYLVPRTREGGKRQGYVPLISKGEGRDLHGAWYYIKLRRIGKRLEYYFDNELALVVEDEAPLDSGSMGIWTFMNSMMVARVKIAAETLEPTRFPFTPVALNAVSSSMRGHTAGSLTATQDLAQVHHSLLVNHGVPVGASTPAVWRVDDAISQSQLSWHREDSRGRYFTVRNVLGSGSMFAAADLRPVPYPELAGWRFEVKRTSHALFNFHFSMGTRDNEGQYQKKRSFFHRISGSGFSDPTRRLYGETPVPPAPGSGDDWHRSGDWTPVQVWLPTETLARYAADSNMLVKVEGVGLLQPGDAAQGLSGNYPGEAYAIRDLVEVRYRRPQLAHGGTTNTAGLPEMAIDVLSGTNEAVEASFSTLAALQAWSDSITNSGLLEKRIRVTTDDDTVESVLSWIMPPPAPPWSCRWSAEAPAAVELLGPTNYPDRHVAFASMTVAGSTVALTEMAMGRRHGFLPRKRAIGSPTTQKVTVSVKSGVNTDEFRLAWKDNELHSAPVLLKLNGAAVFMENFETQEKGKPLQVARRRPTPEERRALGKKYKRLKRRREGIRGVGLARKREGVTNPGTTIRHLDPEQGRYEETSNGGRAGRLKMNFSAPLSLANAPLLQFRYRAEGLAHVSARFGEQQTIKLSEAFSGAREVRHGSPLRLDGQWHTWLGIISDATRKRSLEEDAWAVTTFGVGSFHKVDQTGRFTTLDLDDVTVGAAVTNGEQLVCVPTFFEFEGVESVHMALRSGAEDYWALDDEGREGLTWISIPNDEAALPDVEGLEDGVCHLFLKAVGKNGIESSVTDIPFLLDRRAVDTGYGFETVEGLLENGPRLNLTFDTHGGAPLDLAQLRVSCDSVPGDFKTDLAHLEHQPGKDTLQLNWAYLFRDVLKDATNGQELTVAVSHVVDGAGNVAPDFTVPITMDHAADFTPPTVLSAVLPSNVLHHAVCGEQAETQTGFKPGNKNTIALVHTNSESYLATSSSTTEGLVSFTFGKPPWRPALHPYLVLRLRQPRWNTNDTTAVTLVLETTTKKQFRFALTKPKEKPKDLIPLGTPIRWRSNTWHDVFIDVDVALQDKLTDKEKAGKLVVRSLSLERKKMKKGTPLHLQCLFVLSGWDPDDTVNLDAYDASGIAGIVLNRERWVDGTGFAPGATQSLVRQLEWHTMTARDNAGNSSTPLRVPVCLSPVAARDKPTMDGDIDRVDSRK